MSDDSFSVAGLCLAIFASIVSALGIGAVVGSVAPATSLVFLLPILVAGIIGATQLLIISSFKIRSSFVCVVSSLLSASFCVAGMHEFGRDQFAQAIANNHAHLWPLTSHWFYWIFSTLVIVGGGWLIARSRTDEPFCSTCQHWMSESRIAALSCHHTLVAGVFGSGQLTDIRTLENSSAKSRVSVFTCACEEQDEVVVQVKEQFREYGMRQRKKSRFVFPQTVVDELHDLFFPDDLDGAAAGDDRSQKA